MHRTLTEKGIDMSKYDKDSTALELRLMEVVEDVTSTHHKDHGKHGKYAPSPWDCTFMGLDNDTESEPPTKH